MFSIGSYSYVLDSFDSTILVIFDWILRFSTILFYTILVIFDWILLFSTLLFLSLFFIGPCSYVFDFVFAFVFVFVYCFFSFGSFSCVFNWVMFAHPVSIGCFLQAREKVRSTPVNKKNGCATSSRGRKPGEVVFCALISCLRSIFCSVRAVGIFSLL
jgi:hypothetical protein